jgi:DNA-binding response OmpR family regulator
LKTTLELSGYLGDKRVEEPVAEKQSYTRVNIICDDQVTGSTWASLLTGNGFKVIVSNDQCSKDPADEAAPDLIIIDETYPALDGVSLIKKLKEKGSSTILYLTSQNVEAHILSAYEAGVDECFVKPISPALFFYKAQALLRCSRRAPGPDSNNIQTSDWIIDASRRVVKTSSGKEIRLSKLEYRFLTYLINRPGRVCSSEQLIAAVWEYMDEGDKRLLKHLVYRLRKKVEEDPKKPKRIQTESGVGYKYVP